MHGGLFKELNINIVNQELKNFKLLMANNNIQFFLIGGCCVGAARQQKLLQHDKDIDIGILAGYDLQKITTFLKPSFDEVTISGWERGEIIWAKKIINNLLLIFEIQVHHEKDNTVFMNRDLGASFNKSWRKGSIRWDKKFFKTFDKILLSGEEYLAPSPVDEYLTVQHGDWRKPKQYVDWRYNIANLYEGWL